MGAGVSGLAGAEPGGKVARGAGLGDLPELCTAEVLLRLGARLLRFVDEADEEGGSGRDWSAVGRKDVFARLARPVPFDGGKRVRFLYFFVCLFV
jgi:hypothetical protein